MYTTTRDFSTIQRVYNFIEKYKSSILNVYHLNLGWMEERDTLKKTLIFSFENGWEIDITNDTHLVELCDFIAFRKRVLADPAKMKLWNVDARTIEKIDFDFLSQMYVFETQIPFSSLYQ